MKLRLESFTNLVKQGKGISVIESTIETLVDQTKGVSNIFPALKPIYLKEYRSVSEWFHEIKEVGKGVYG